MISLGQKIENSIDDFVRGHYEKALQGAAVAIDVTARRRYGGSEPAGPSHAQLHLLHDYAWLIEIMAFGGAKLGDSWIEDFPIEGKAEPSFQDLVDLVVLRNLEDDARIRRRIEFTDLETIIVEKGNLAFPRKLIWALLAICVFCPCNAGETAAEGYWLSIFGNRFVLNDFWGQEQVARIVYEKRKPA